VAAFGMVLRIRRTKGRARWPTWRSGPGSIVGDAGGYRAEFISLVERAQSVLQ